MEKFELNVTFFFGGREAVCLLPLKIGIVVDVADVVPVGDWRCRKGIYVDVDAVVDCFCGGSQTVNIWPNCNVRWGKEQGD